MTLIARLKGTKNKFSFSCSINSDAKAQAQSNVNLIRVGVELEYMYMYMYIHGMALHSITQKYKHSIYDGMIRSFCLLLIIKQRYVYDYLLPMVTWNHSRTLLPHLIYTFRTFFIYILIVHNATLIYNHIRRLLFICIKALIL